MEIEELMKQLAQGGINVQGDLVMKKEVQYEVSNVENGGIGIQVVNGNVAAQANPASDKSQAAEVDMTEAHPSFPRGPRKQYLFIEGDASWEKEGKLRNPSKENAVVRRRERDRFLSYLKEHGLSNRELTCIQGDTLNNVVACFLVEWQHRGLIAQNFAGTSVWRFLTEECDVKSTVTPNAYSKEIREWVDEKLFNVKTQKIVRDFF